jgi:hypothetical protein
VLRCCGISQLARLDRRERQVVRYEHPAPGDLLHADFKKLGNIPTGGGSRSSTPFAHCANRAPKPIVSARFA